MSIPRLNLSSWQRLLLASTLTALLFLVCLRLFTCEVTFTAYLKNYLFACALFGLALGCMNVRLKRFPVKQSGWLLTFLIILIFLAGIQLLNGRNLSLLKDSSTYFLADQFLHNYPQHELTIAAILFLSFSLMVHCFIPLGSHVGCLADRMEPAAAACLILSGTILGLGLYGISLWLFCPPFALITLLTGGYLLLWGLNIRNVVLSFLALACTMSIDAITAPGSANQFRASHSRYFQNFWAPEFQVQTYPYVVGGTVAGLVVVRNGSPWEIVFDPNSKEGFPNGKRAQDKAAFPPTHYQVPYLMGKKPGTVLILGAAGGNSVAEALKCGAQKIDAVDAHGWLFGLSGPSPLKPFSSKLVTAVVMDPRQFLRSTRNKYDLIIFDNLESTTAFSALAPLRTDNFVYSSNSFAEARAHLNPGGYLAVSVKAPNEWYLLRLSHNVRLAFGKIGALVRSDKGNYILASASDDGPSLHELVNRAHVGNVEKLTQHAGTVVPTFDEWPFLFLATPSVPRTYIFCLILLMAAMLGQLRQLLATSPYHNISSSPAAVVWTRQNICLAMRASAFMLVACKAVITLALNFGSTWHIAILSAIAVFLVALCAALLSLLKIQLRSVIFWLLVVFALAGDFSFNYQAVAAIADPGLRFTIRLLPLLSVFFVAAAVLRAAKGVEDLSLSLGFVLCGLVIGTFLQYLCFLAGPMLGISHLHVLAVILCLASGLLGRRRAPHTVESQTTATCPEAR